jgi:hypothetical protein
MLRSVGNGDGGRFPHSPLLRGYSVVYRENEVNHCPGCGRSHWYVGRLSAECGFCATAIPLSDGRLQGLGGHSRNWKPFELSELAA